MAANMVVGQALSQYIMMDFSNEILSQCWDVCYDRNLTRAELTSGGGLTDAKESKMEACGRKCVARHFEVMKLMMDTRTLREQEMMQGLAPGTLTGQQL